jgi:hypothetical protein
MNEIVNPAGTRSLPRRERSLIRLKYCSICLDFFEVIKVSRGVPACPDETKWSRWRGHDRMEKQNASPQSWHFVLGTKKLAPTGVQLGRSGVLFHLSGLLRSNKDQSGSPSLPRRNEVGSVAESQLSLRCKNLGLFYFRFGTDLEIVRMGSMSITRNLTSKPGSNLFNTMILM